MGAYESSRDIAWYNVQDPDYRVCIIGKKLSVSGGPTLKDFEDVKGLLEDIIQRKDLYTPQTRGTFDHRDLQKYLDDTGTKIWVAE